MVSDDASARVWLGSTRWTLGWLDGSPFNYHNFTSQRHALLSGDSVITMDRIGQWYHEVDVRGTLEEDPGETVVKNYVVCTRKANEVWTSEEAGGISWTAVPFIVMGVIVVILLVVIVIIRNDKDVSISYLVFSKMAR